MTLFPVLALTFHTLLGLADDLEEHLLQLGISHAIGLDSQHSSITVQPPKQSRICPRSQVPVGEDVMELVVGFRFEVSSCHVALDVQGHLGSVELELCVSTGKIC